MSIKKVDSIKTNFIKTINYKNDVNQKSWFNKIDVNKKSWFIKIFIAIKKNLLIDKKKFYEW